MILSDFDELSTSFIPKGSRVLDLGCADGKIGEFIQKELNCYVTGVEIDLKLSQFATHRLKKIITGDLEDHQIQAQIIKQGKFDILFASGILEHLKNPREVLINLKPALKNNALLIITLPNIAYWRIRLELLLGRFDYTDSGIMDKSHLRLFTIKSAKKFVEKECSLKIEGLNYDIPEVPVISKIIKFIVGKDANFNMFKLFPNLFAYQIVILAKPK